MRIITHLSKLIQKHCGNYELLIVDETDSQRELCHMEVQLCSIKHSASTLADAPHGFNG